MITKEQITAIREKVGLTKTEFGNLMDVSSQTVNRWEEGLKSPTDREEMMLLGLLKLIEDGGDNLDINKMKAFSKTKSAGAIASLLGVIGSAVGSAALSAGGGVAATGAATTIAATGAAAVGGALLAPILGPVALAALSGSALAFFLKNKASDGKGESKKSKKG